MRILIVGAGAVGGYFGARLIASGRDVTLLVRAGRAEQLRRDGLQILSPYGDFTVRPNLILASELAAHPDRFDLIVVGTKSYSLDRAMEDFAPGVGPQTVILPLLNGLAHLDALDARFGREHVLGGSVRVVADIDDAGRVHQIERLHMIQYGERFGGEDPSRGAVTSIQQVDAVFREAGVEAVLSPDILAFMWQKWVFLAALGAITCTLRGTIGQIVAAPGGLETVHAIIAETAAIAQANGYPTPQPFLENSTSRLTKPGSALTASMYRDMLRGAPVEADHILGDLLARGRRREVPAPLLRAAYVQLSIYSSSTAAAEPGPGQPQSSR